MIFYDIMTERKDQIYNNIMNYLHDKAIVNDETFIFDLKDDPELSNYLQFRGNVFNAILGINEYMNTLDKRFIYDIIIDEYIDDLSDINHHITTMLSNGSRNRITILQDVIDNYEDTYLNDEEKVLVQNVKEYIEIETRKTTKTSAVVNVCYSTYESFMHGFQDYINKLKVKSINNKMFILRLNTLINVINSKTVGEYYNNLIINIMMNRYKLRFYTPRKVVTYTNARRRFTNIIQEIPY